MNKLQELNEKYEKQINRIEEIACENSPLRVKAKFITCGNCESKLAKEYLKRNYTHCNCPLCGHNLFSHTALKRINAAKEKAANLRKQMEMEARKASPAIKMNSAENAFSRALNDTRDRLEVIYEEIKTPDFVELHGNTGGDSLCFRVYKDGSVCEK